MEAKLTFRQRVLKSLGELPPGYFQRIDGLRCEPLLIGRKWWFFNLRLELMVCSGLLHSTAVGSFWPSLDGMPGYALTEFGRFALAKQLPASLPEEPR